MHLFGNSWEKERRISFCPLGHSSFRLKHGTFRKKTGSSRTQVPDHKNGPLKTEKEAEFPHNFRLQSFSPSWEFLL
ncbi:hypothetical protein A0128_16570 [Leptospira tipperaryensis]|uniref:Uncharacterized protein n=1 Tax=Leptospira tipperaryensis TaxID=2564040 RepID=A0A1D7V0F0_9LEPT|nr:hypothetical protein A0128_16570 [Leptospira tipperaryensis]